MIEIFAYLDPGTGSILLQALLGGAAGLLVGIKLFGRRMLDFLKFWKREPAPSEPAAAPVDES